MTTAAQPFGHWRLRGGRYEEPGLPVETLAEFARYERLVVDVAKGLYKQRHARRKRVPRGFASGFALRLTDVQPGSVIPVLEVHSATTELFEFDAQDIFDEARLLIQDTLRAVAAGNEIPRTFPPQALREFSRFGRSLRDDEYLVLDEGTPHQAEYSQAVRRLLQERAKLEHFEVESQVIGQIVGLLADKAQFEFRLSENGKTVSGEFTSDEVIPDLKQYLDLSTMAPTVALSAVVLQSMEGVDIAISDVLSVEPVLPSAWSTRLAELASLEAGWFDGEGEPVRRQVLRQAESILLECLDSQIERPRIFPTESGGVHFEWAFTGGEVSVDIRSDGSVEFYSFSKSDDDRDREESFGWADIEDVVEAIRGGIDEHTSIMA
jgi:hypothetical protein